MSKQLSSRGAPFWSWNDDLDVKELRRQVREMARAGLGGHMMHARIGLVTPYLGKEWMDCIRAAVDESRKAGMEAWLYDENCWPSGSAGGRVQARGPEYWAKRFAPEFVDDPAAPRADNELARYAVSLDSADEYRATSWRRLAEGETPAAGEKIWRLRVNATRGYVDLLHPKVVAAFIEEDYHVYESVVGDEFGKTIPGVFTDEPQYLGDGVPWSPALPDAYAERWSADVLDALPAVFFDGQPELRYQFWRTVSEQFVQSFSKQIGDWCRARNLVFTGHLNAEDGLICKMWATAGVMPHYEHFGMPGIDHLGRSLGTVVLCKQLSSVARQLGRKRALSETFGCTGWNVSFGDLRQIAEYQIALGIDFLCQHLSLYSLRGCRKRDYPPSLHVQQPWWTFYRGLNTTFSREIDALIAGEPVVDVLLLHPMETYYRVYRPDRPPRVYEFNTQFEQLSRAILAAERDFDYGCESIMEAHARVEGAELVVGDSRYRVVVVPPECAQWRPSTVQLLADFEAAGGKVVRLTEWTPSDLAERLAQACPPRWTLATEDTPERLETRHVALPDGVERLFMANSAAHQRVKGTFSWQSQVTLYNYDPETGQYAQLATHWRDGATVCELTLAPKQSILLETRPGEPTTIARVAAPRGVVAKLEGPWQMKLLAPNTLTIDHADLAINGQAIRGDLPIHACQDAIKTAVQAGQTGVAQLTYRFKTNQAVYDSCELAVELPGPLELHVNGQRESLAGWPNWFDVSLHRIPIGADVVEGLNEITLDYPLAADTEVESVYLLGKFGVHMDFLEDAPRRDDPALPSAKWYSRQAELRALPAKAPVGDLTGHGLPYYAGAVELTTSVMLEANPHLWLTLDDPQAIVAMVSVNGVDIATRAFAPWEYRLGDAIKTGKNTIAIRLTNSLRNLMGPHHHVDGEIGMVSAGAFVGQRSWTDLPGEGPTWRDDVCVVPFGLSEAPKIERSLNS